MQKTQFILLQFVLLLLPILGWADNITGAIVDIHDGDTVTIQVPGQPKKFKVRMLGVDTPEVEFFQYSQGDAAYAARDYLRSLAPVGSNATVEFESDGFDKHNRILGRIIVNGIEVNREMLKSGWGYIYFIFPFDKKTAVEYSQIAKVAVENQQGLFSEKYASTQAPYEFRLSVRNQVGRNLIGNIQTKRLFTPEESFQVPYWSRVFFSEENLAKQNGYSF